MNQSEWIDNGADEPAETRCLGLHRGAGWNPARLHLTVRPADISESEAAAFEAAWSERFPSAPVSHLNRIKGSDRSDQTGWTYEFHTRREFATLPAIIRAGEAAGYGISVSQYEVGVRGGASLDGSPAKFWKAIAMAMAFYGKEERE